MNGYPEQIGGMTNSVMNYLQGLGPEVLKALAQLLMGPPKPTQETAQMWAANPQQYWPQIERQVGENVGQYATSMPIGGTMSVGPQATLREFVRTLPEKDQGYLRGAITRIMHGNHEGEGDVLSWTVENLRSGLLSGEERTKAIKELIDFEKKYAKWGRESEGLAEYSEELWRKSQQKKLQR